MATKRGSVWGDQWIVGVLCLGPGPGILCAAILFTSREIDKGKAL